MKPVCCDTSFLFALYGNDVHTAKALALVRRLRQPLTLSVFNEFELKNALRFAGWRKLFSATQIGLFQAAYEADRNAGRLVAAPCNLTAIITEARRLSASYTLNHGHRSFDLLHVAVALHLGAGEFLSFDANQRKLARTEGLKLNV
ncbi:MAG TPA: type II toxin-antitoxin system VapC family toxin [Candidatus Methylacidiphilales bacterium]|nr:type II toxin-antitoxin system VapC family toxin [Candidatus Methylacidiphilales bacterium]